MSNTTQEHDNKTERFEIKINESTKLLYNVIKDMNNVYHNDFILSLLGHYLVVNADKEPTVRTLCSTVFSNDERKHSLSVSALNNLSNLKIPQIYNKSIIDDIIVTLRHIVNTNPQIDVSVVPKSILDLAELRTSTKVVDSTTLMSIDSSVSVPTIVTTPTYLPTSSLTLCDKLIPKTVERFKNHSLNSILREELVELLEYQNADIKGCALTFYLTRYAAISARLTEIAVRSGVPKSKIELHVKHKMDAIRAVIVAYDAELNSVIRLHCDSRDLCNYLNTTNPNIVSGYINSRLEMEKLPIIENLWDLSLSKINEIISNIPTYTVEKEFKVTAATLKHQQVKLKVDLGSLYESIFATETSFTSI